MADAVTKQYFNTTDKPLNVLGVGEIAPHDRISITTAYPPAIVMENYPGLVEMSALPSEEQRVIEEEHLGKPSGKIAVKTEETSLPPTAPINTTPGSTL